MANKSYLEMWIRECVKYCANWEWKKNYFPYSNFFTMISGNLQPKERACLIGFINNFELKWGYELATCEKIIFTHLVSKENKLLTRNKKIKHMNGSSVWWEDRKEQINPMKMIGDLERIKHWCLIMLRKYAEGENVSFEHKADSFGDTKRDIFG